MAQPLDPPLPLRVLIPNLMTTLALCVGLSGIRLALVGNWDKALMAIVLAGVLDGLDGWVARRVRGTSRFGAELDSLADTVSFGVAPALIIYLWALHELGGLGWVIALSHAVCCALRLARYNAQAAEGNAPHTPEGFFTGVPAPAGAGLVLSPVFLDLWLGTQFFRTPLVAAIITVGVAVLMVSTVPTYSWRAIRLRPSWRLPLLIVAGLTAAALLTAPWGTLSLVSLAYLASLPFAWRSYRRRAAAAKNNAGGAAPDAEAP